MDRLRSQFPKRGAKGPDPGLPIRKSGLGPAPATGSGQAGRVASLSGQWNPLGGPQALGSGLDSDRIFRQLLREAGPLDVPAPPPGPGQELIQAARQQLQEAVPLEELPPLGRVPPYNPTKDTAQNYEQACARLASQIEALAGQGAAEHQILSFRLQRRAEIDQMFPKQALLEQAEQRCLETARLMRDRGDAPEEIHRYLKRKAADYKRPTPAEIKAFTDSRKAFADSIASIGRRATAASAIAVAARQAASQAPAAPGSASPARGPARVHPGPAGPPPGPRPANAPGAAPQQMSPKR